MISDTPSSGDTSQVPTWWKIGAGGSSLVTNTPGNFNSSLSWGSASIGFLVSVGSNLSCDSYVDIVPNVTAPTAKFFAMVGASSNNGRSIVENLAITVNGEAQTPSNVKSLSVEYPAPGNMYNIQIGMIPVRPNTPVRIAWRTRNNTGGSNGGKSLIVFEK